jgi:hypothetical protein
MSKFLGATLLGAVSILLLAGLGASQSPDLPQLAVALPSIAGDATRSGLPRECSVEANVTTDCVY